MSGKVDAFDWFDAFHTANEAVMENVPPLKIDQEALMKWKDNLRYANTDDQNYGDFVSENLVHVSFQEFYDTLLRSVYQFTRSFVSKKHTKDKRVLLIDTENKGHLWASLLAWRHLVKYINVVIVDNHKAELAKLSREKKYDEDIDILFVDHVFQPGSQSHDFIVGLEITDLLDNGATFKVVAGAYVKSDGDQIFEQSLPLTTIRDATTGLTKSERVSVYSALETHYMGSFKGSETMVFFDHWVPEHLLATVFLAPVVSQKMDDVVQNDLPDEKTTLVAFHSLIKGGKTPQKYRVTAKDEKLVYEFPEYSQWRTPYFEKIQYRKSNW